MTVALVALAGCGSGDDDIESIAADACDDMVAAAQDQDAEAMMAANEDAMQRAEAVTGDPLEAQMELLEAFDGACPELEEILLEDIEQG